jgi:hypothetical protein
MKENDVVQIAEQFGLEKSIVEASVNDGTLGTRIKDSLSNKVIYDADKFEAFKKNHAAEVTNNYYNELVEQTRKGEAPQEIYKNIKGSAYQQLERELSKEFGVDEFKDVKDLINKAITKTSANGKQGPEIDKLINDLKAANVQLKAEKENAVLTVQNEYKGKFLNTEMNQILEQIPFDFSDAKADELADKKQNVQTILKSVFNGEYKLDTDAQGRTIVLKGADVLKNQATLEPLPLKDVLTNLANKFNLKLISPDTGGQGGKSSGQSAGYKFQTPNEFYEYCAANKIDVAGPEAMKLLKENPFK